MKKRNLLVLAGALLIGSGALVGCGGNSNSKAVQLKVWCAAEDDNFIKGVIWDFQQANPDVEYKFKVESVSEGDALTTVQKDLALTADVFHFAGDQLVPLQKNGALYEIPSSFTEKLGIDPGCLNAGQIDGKQYGIPFIPNTYFLYYD